MPGQHLVLLDRGVQAELERAVPGHLTGEHPRAHRQHPLTWRDVSGRVISIRCHLTLVRRARAGIEPICPTPPERPSPGSSCRIIRAKGGRFRPNGGANTSTPSSTCYAGDTRGGTSARGPESRSRSCRDPKPGHGFIAQPRRWVVERTNGWINHCRRIDRDYETTLTAHEGFLVPSQIALLLRRLDRS